MRRSRSSRVLSAIFAIWLALVMGEAGFAHHHCPMHDGPIPSAMSGNGMLHGTGHGDAHASHGEDGNPAPAGHHLCTCIGACTASSGAATIAEAPALPAAQIAYIAVTVPERREPRASGDRAPFTLPFPNGPPQRIA